MKRSLKIFITILLVIAVVAIAYVLYKGIIALWKAAESILKAFIGLLSVLVSILPFILVAGLIAAATSYVIQNVNL